MIQIAAVLGEMCIRDRPWEGLDSFLQSFDDVYRMEPDQLQLGFLKVLKGSYMASPVSYTHLLYQGEQGPVSPGASGGHRQQEPGGDGGPQPVRSAAGFR